MRRALLLALIAGCASDGVQQREGVVGRQAGSRRDQLMLAQAIEEASSRAAMAFADRVAMYCYNGGLLTDPVGIERVNRCADYIDEGGDRSGFIGLQVHSGHQGQVRWRNILITEL